MQEYTVIKRGQSIQPCIKIPDEFLDMELEIKIRPLRPKEHVRSKLEKLLKDNEGVNPFKVIQNPQKWQSEIRDEWG